MSLKDNTSGLLLDKSTVRTTHVNLPLIKRTRSYEWEGDTTLQAEDMYGEVMFFGDWHLGSEAHARNPFNAYLKLIATNPHMKVVLMGDYFEYSEKSSNISDEIMDVDDQIELFIGVLRTLRSQIIAILAGNHDHRLTKYTGRRRYLQGFAREAGIDPEETYVGLPQRGINIFADAGDYRYSIYCLHGSTGAWRNKNTQLKRMAVSRRHTLLTMGHVHQVLWEPSLYLEPMQDGSIEARLQYWLATGGFLKDASYAEAKSYPPSLVGAPVVRFSASTNELDMWQLPYRSHYFDGGKMALADITDIIGNSIEGGMGGRPPCPVCGGTRIISRGHVWNCKSCGKYYSK